MAASEAAGPCGRPLAGAGQGSGIVPLLRLDAARPGVHGVSGLGAAISALRHEYGDQAEPYLAPRRE
jgi:hypothetical protein